MLLLNGSGVGRAYDDDLCLTNWDYSPNLRVVIDAHHPDYNYETDEDVRTARHKYRGQNVIWHEVADTREGWAKAVEVWETLTFEKVHFDKTLVLDFSKVRAKGEPIKGMQNRPSSGPKPLMEALQMCATIKGSGMAPWLQALYIDHYLAFTSCRRFGRNAAAFRWTVTMAPFIDLTGRVFGEWTVLRRHQENYRNNSRWLCRCSCGTVRVLTGTNLRNGKSTSCGHSRLTAGGLSHSYQSEYDTWRQMIIRCTDPSCRQYKDYGARGIRVSPGWNDFQTFLDDMGPRPPGCQLDRVDNDGDYRPGNCRWVPPIVNVHNSTRVRILKYDGLSLPVAEWARRLGVDASVLYSRLRYGWSVERTLSEPVRVPARRRED